MRDELGDWLLSCSRLPVSSSRGLLVARPQVLVLATRFGAYEVQLDLSEFASTYGLTPAEGRFCQAMAQGRNLSDAALVCGISYETARSRIKEIFAKTQNKSQVDLLLMLEAFRDS